MGPCILSFAFNMCARIHINCPTYSKMKYNKKLHNILITKLKKEMTKKKKNKESNLVKMGLRVTKHDGKTHA